MLVTETATKTLLQVEHAQIGYQTPAGFHVAVGDVSFEIAPRERIVVIGPSGGGKSTLLKAIAGFLPLAGGSIVVDGRPSPPPGPDRAVVFQEFDQLFAWRTVLDNVAYPLRVNGRSRREAATIAREYLELMHLGAAAKRHPHELSGGMKQRVAIARALALEPLVLLMDEPFGSLDAITRTRLQNELLANVERVGVTLLFVTHSIDEALVIGERIVVLSHAPSSVREIVDVRGVGGRDTPEYAEMRPYLRSLLTVDGEDEEEDEAHG
ncbi:MAG TPA: ABC transporter ATP-binding protein [Gaiellaceae bacterium]